jgi:RNA polymerase sigma-70 factor (ECF subfamily)
MGLGRKSEWHELRMEDADPGFALMERVRLGQSVAFEQLCNDYHGLVFRAAARVVGREAAEDITQVVFLKLFQCPGAFRGGSFKSWIARVSRNRALDEVRRRECAKAAVLLLEPGHEIEVSADVISRIDGERLHRSLSSLPERERNLIELNFFGDLAHGRIAEVTGIPLGTIKTRIRTGLIRMRSDLGDAQLAV